MRIGEMAQAAGISEYTLRYYEKKGLIRVRRDDAGRRCYDESDIEWIKFIKRLKDTGMPIKEIRHYAELRADGDPTLSERMEMLIHHRQALNEQIARLQAHKIKLDEKIEFYRNEIEHMQQNMS